MRWHPTFLRLAVLSVAIGALILPGASRAGSARLSMLENAPLYFEANHGQAEGGARFIARGLNVDVLLAPDEAALVLSRRAESTVAPAPFVSGGGMARTRIVRLKLEGANPRAGMTGLEPMPAQANYFIGDDPAAWRTGVPLCSRVKADEVYPGIDLVYYADQSARLEYDFLLEPRARPDAISFRIEGADKVSVNASGELVLKIGADEVRQHRPVIYQETATGRQPVPGGYRLTGKARVGFWTGQYDRSLPLVIDPVLTFSTFLGGSKSDNGWGIAVDSTGIYVTGETVSKDLRTTPGAFDRQYNGGIAQFGDAFVAKYALGGSNLIYLTYLGGKTDDGGLSIAVDGIGNAYVTGFTDSRNFPVAPTNNPINNRLSGRDNNAFLLFPVNAFVTALDPTGSSLVFSTLIGGGKRDAGEGIAVDGSGVYVVGMTESTNFPVTPAAFQTNYGGGGDAFVAKLGLSGTTMIYATYLGGKQQDFGEAITVNSGNAFVAGFTGSTNFPTTNAIVVRRGTNDITYDQLNARSGPSIATDAFVTELSSDGTTLLLSTYLGGGNNDAAHGIAADAAGNAYVAGHTSSRDFPTNVVNSMRTNFTTQAFVTRIGPGGGTNVLSTRFGSGGANQGRAVAVDAANVMYVTGFTDSTNLFGTNVFTRFRTTNAPPSGTAKNPNNVFVAVLNPDGTFGTNSVFLGGSGNDVANGIVVDPSGAAAYVVGRTLSGNFPTTNAPQKRLGGTSNSKDSDAFVGKIEFQ